MVSAHYLHVCVCACTHIRTRRCTCGERKSDSTTVHVPPVFLPCSLGLFRRMDSCSEHSMILDSPLYTTSGLRRMLSQSKQEIEENHLRRWAGLNPRKERSWTDTSLWGLGNLSCRQRQMSRDEFQLQLKGQAWRASQKGYCLHKEQEQQSIYSKPWIKTLKVKIRKRWYYRRIWKLKQES